MTSRAGTPAESARLSEPLTALAATLRPLAGAHIALIAPAGGVADPRIDTALAVMSTAGIRTWLGAQARAHHRYLAGTVAQRLDDLYQAFAQPGVDAVWCLRGGYGTAHLADRIDWDRIPDDIPLIGYSDITQLLEAFRQAGKTGIHGPTATDLAMPGDEPTAQAQRRASIASLAAALAGAALNEPGRQEWPLDGVSPTFGAGPGTPSISGHLVGGNLTTLASMAGTAVPLRLDTPSILLLEDVGEAEFRLERAFHQLLSSISPERLMAVGLGEFTRCQLADGMASWRAIVAEWLAPYDVPLFSGLPLGHGPINHAWRCGAPAQLQDHRLIVEP